MTNAIPNDVALRMCEGIRKQNRSRWYSFFGVWCYMCKKVSKGNATKLCFHGRPDNYGCSQVNKLYGRAKR